MKIKPTMRVPDDKAQTLHSLIAKGLAELVKQPDGRMRLLPTSLGRLHLMKDDAPPS